MTKEQKEQKARRVVIDSLMRGNDVVAQAPSGGIITAGVDEAKRRINVTLKAGPDAPELRFALRPDSASILAIMIECCAQYLTVVPAEVADA